MYSRAAGDGADVFCPMMESESINLPAITGLESSSSSAQMYSAAPLNLDEFFAGADDSRDIFVRKERVRAKKAGAWLQSERMVPDLAQTIIGTAPAESYLHMLLLEHGQETWTGQYGLHHLPLVTLCQPHRSPAARILDEYYKLQNSPVEVALECLAKWPGIDMQYEQERFFPALDRHVLQCLEEAGHPTLRLPMAFGCHPRL